MNFSLTMQMTLRKDSIFWMASKRHFSGFHSLGRIVSAETFHKACYHSYKYTSKFTQVRIGNKVPRKNIFEMRIRLNVLTEVPGSLINRSSNYDRTFDLLKA